MQPAYWHQTNLETRIQEAIKLFPCDLLFIHCDAEQRDASEKRVEEITNVLATLSECSALPAICVVPVRMTEAWLLFDEQAIRDAAGNSRGRIVLDMIGMRLIEDLADPKAKLKEMLRKASELSGRRLDKFDVNHARQRVAELIEDFAPLRSLTAFQRLEADIKRIVQQQGWNEQPENQYPRNP